jgi:Glycosyltransferase WbsX
VQRPSLIVLLVVLAVFTGCRLSSIGTEGIPPPAPVSTGGYLVGAYYFPGWPSYAKWRQLDDFPERMPLLGYYREGDPVVMDWQIKWAVEHGISFFAFDWYWDRGERQLEHALRDGYLHARFRSSLKFCLLWANHNAPGSFSEPDLLAVVDHWIDHYFRLPEYLTLDGRPMVIIFSPSSLTSDMGSEAVRQGFDRMRARARERGFPDLFIVAATGPGGVPLEKRLGQRKFEGYDAATGYNYPRAGMDDDGLRGSYDAAVAGYQAIWDAIARAGIIEYFPVTEPGWDSRPWDGDKALVRTERHPEKFKLMLANARRFTDSHPVAGGRKIVLVEAWNEYGEGAVIEPHCEWRFAYLDAVREVFSTAPRTHRDATPGELGLSVPQVACPPGRCAGCR